MASNQRLRPLLTFLLIFSLISVTPVEGKTYPQYYLLPQGELLALQKVFAAWNKSTPDLKGNLAGWGTFDPYDPTFLNQSTTLTAAQLKTMNTSNYVDPCFYDYWKGLRCSSKSRFTRYYLSDFDAAVVGLTLEDASIAGNLPPEIWDFEQLISLTLTGNPNLVGPIPPFIKNSTVKHDSLNILDLHNNGLSGEIPFQLGDKLYRLKELDLSDNQLNGSLWKSTLGSIKFLQTLKLSNNQFTSYASTIDPSIDPSPWKDLFELDLSRNKFQEPLPSFSSCQVLHTLNMSHNKFNGQIIMDNFNPNATKSLTIFDLSDNNFLGPMPNLGNWATLKFLNLSNNGFDSTTFPTWLDKLHQNLEIISLSSTSLVGEFNFSIFKYFSNLRSIELDDNFINGTLDISSLFRNSTNLKMLYSMSMRNNNITDVIFNHSIPLANLLATISLQGNPYCSTNPNKGHDTWKCFCYQICSDALDLQKSGGNQKKVITLSSLLSGFLFLVLFILAVFLLKAKKDKQYLLLMVQKNFAERHDPSSFFAEFAEYDMKPTLYGLHELQKATRDFHIDMKLGEGGFGAVYKGYLGDGSAIAVKQLLSSREQKMDEFLNEVVLLTSVKHRNLVKLKGCCFTGSQRLLVYEYVENYDLADTLFDHKGEQLLNWAMRFDICMGIAQGLHYLHALVEPRIIHRDIKASNILLDKNMQPKIADFGLALLYPNESTTHITLVEVAGTKGYMAPEYIRVGKVSEKIDVYSFGVLLLEIVSGRRNIDVNAPLEQAYLPEWARELNQSGNLMGLVDQTIKSFLHTKEEYEVQQVIKVALCCLQTAPERRPTMAQVVAMFGGAIEVGSIQNLESIDRMHDLAFQTPSRFNTSETIDLPNAYFESHALYTGPSSSKGTQELELSEMKQDNK